MTNRLDYFIERLLFHASYERGWDFERVIKAAKNDLDAHDEMQASIEADALNDALSDRTYGDS